MPSLYIAKNEVLRGVSFVLEAGRSAGLVGPSGGGKSTVMVPWPWFWSLPRTFFVTFCDLLFLCLEKKDL